MLTISFEEAMAVTDYGLAEGFTMGDANVRELCEEADRVIRAVVEDRLAGLARERMTVVRHIASALANLLLVDLLRHPGVR